MVDLAQKSPRCECGSRRLYSDGAALEPGALVICNDCGTPSRVTAVLVRVEWSEVENEFDQKPHDRWAFEWVRKGATALVPSAIVKGVSWSALAISVALIALTALAVHS